MSLPNSMNWVSSEDMPGHLQPRFGRKGRDWGGPEPHPYIYMTLKCTYIGTVYPIAPNVQIGARIRIDILTSGRFGLGEGFLQVSPMAM